MRKYLKKYAIYCIVFVLNIIICLYLASIIKTSMIWEFIIKVAIICIVPNILNIFCLNNVNSNDEFYNGKDPFYAYGENAGIMQQYVFYHIQNRHR